MTRKVIPFFATPGDLTSLIQAASSERPLSFLAAGLSDEEPGPVFHDFKNHEPLQTYLVFDRDQNVTVERVPQRKGSVKYAVDQLKNPHTVSVRSGGLLDGKRLIAGQLGTVAKGPSSDQIYSLLKKTIRRQFTKIKSYFVGPEAAQLLDKGFRLAPTKKSPPTYDLVR
jgi:hypothetical protein